MWLGGLERLVRIDGVAYNRPVLRRTVWFVRRRRKEAGSRSEARVEESVWRD